MTDWVEAGALADLRRKRKIVVRVGDRDVVVLADGDRVYALDNLCVHKQRPLSKGLVFKGKIVCPGHQWAFDLETGWVDEWAMCQPTHKVKIEDGVVWIDSTPHSLTEAPVRQQAPTA